MRVYALPHMRQQPMRAAEYLREETGHDYVYFLIFLNSLADSHCHDAAGVIPKALIPNLYKFGFGTKQQLPKHWLPLWANRWIHKRRRR